MNRMTRSLELHSHRLPNRISAPKNPIIKFPRDSQLSKTFSGGFFKPPFHGGEGITQRIRSINRNLQKRKSKNKLINDANLSIAKEELILALKEELKYHKQREKALLNYKNYTDGVCGYYLQNLQEAITYKDRLNQQLKDFRVVLNNYEETEQKLKRERNNLISTNEDILKFKSNEKTKNKNDLSKLSQDLEKQTKNVEGLRSKINNYRKQNTSYFEDLEKNQKNSLLTYNSLLRDYEVLKNKFSYLADYDNAVKEDKFMKTHEVKSENVKEVDLRLQDTKVREQYLKGILNELNQKIKMVEDSTKQAQLDQERMRFLGKTLYKKLYGSN